MPTWTINIAGKVQGVFFRKHTQAEALQLGVTGNVRNLPDGSVQVVASGSEEQLQALASWCRTGPPRARVEVVDIQPAADQSFSGFTIER